MNRTKTHESGLEFPLRGKPCSKCGHRKTSHYSDYCQIMGCDCSGYTQRKDDQMIQQTQDGTPVTVKHAGSLTEISKGDRHPSVIIGSIRQRVEWLLKRNEGLDEQSAANYSDTHRIDQLLSELDSALLTSMLTKSLEGK